MSARSDGTSIEERFVREGMSALSEEEALGLLLSVGSARMEQHLLARRLLDEFGDLRGIMNSSLNRLLDIPGVDEEIALLIRLTREFSRFLWEESEPPADLLNSSKQLQRYLMTRFRNAKEEKVLVLCLDAQGGVLGEEILGAGTVDRVIVFPRQVVSVALRYGASRLILAHSHPHGPPIPSAHDRQEAHRLKEILRPFDLDLIDSIVVGKNGCFSVFKHESL